MGKEMALAQRPLCLVARQSQFHQSFHSLFILLLASEETIKEEKSRKTFQMSLGEDEFRDNTTPEKTKPAEISSFDSGSNKFRR
ncbi:hypothetical protein CEXT_553661 [Caerostris extrusa]|uniref:Uncharacterized protein n=1 Tax=Caerostris extrusa TaxID=172846 RepID=A0AAV4Q2T3_CAEEX|nr:hypothetical protein CEXT_553661 [Caerostris extrusa]